MKARLSRHAGPAALIVSVVALLASVSGVADAARSQMVRAFAKPKANAVLKLDKRKRFPASVIPKVRSARQADTLEGQSADALTGKCDPTAVDLGTWCLLASPYPLEDSEVGRNDYAFASQKCVELGGYLPTAAQLIGAAARVKLSSTIDDSPLNASIDQDAGDGLRDRREMSATLATTQAGSSAAGSQGVSEGSKGDPKAGEPDPVPQPANPSPESLQYVTVYDNRDKGGFAGSRPVAQAEAFRCGFDKRQGEAPETD